MALFLGDEQTTGSLISGLTRRVHSAGAISSLHHRIPPMHLPPKYAWERGIIIRQGHFLLVNNELKAATLETLRIDAPANAILTNSRPSFNNPGAILLRFRELEGQNAEVKLSSAVPGRIVQKMTEVNPTGKALGQPVQGVQLKPYEVKFIEVEF